MEQMNFHKQKLYLLIGAGIALIACFLPWWAMKGGLGGYGFGNVNGLKSWGLLTLLGVIGVIVATFMGDKSTPYLGQTRQIVLYSYGAIALGAVLVLLRILTAGRGGVRISQLYSPGFGLFIALIVGIVGILFLLGKINIPAPKQKV